MHPGVTVGDIMIISFWSVAKVTSTSALQLLPILPIKSFRFYPNYSFCVSSCCGHHYSTFKRTVSETCFKHYGWSTCAHKNKENLAFWNFCKSSRKVLFSLASTNIHTKLWTEVNSTSKCPREIQKQELREQSKKTMTKLGLTETLASLHNNCENVNL